MKKNIFLIVFGILQITAKSQISSCDVEKKIDSKIYCYNSVNEVNKIIVRNQKNTLFGEKIKLPKGSEEFPFSNKFYSKEIIDLFWNIFTEEELKKLSACEKLFVTFYYDQSGNVIELHFMLNKGSQLSLAQISKIDEKLRNLKLFLVANEFIGVNFLFQMRVIDFKKIYNKIRFD